MAAPSTARLSPRSAWTRPPGSITRLKTNLLGSGANYIDLYYALYQACVSLVGTGGISAADCQEVRNATDAVQMNMTRSATMYPTVDYCPSGQSIAQDLFTDDFESGSANWTFGAVSGSQLWLLDTTNYDASSKVGSLRWCSWCTRRSRHGGVGFICGDEYRRQHSPGPHQDLSALRARLQFRFLPNVSVGRRGCVGVQHRQRQYLERPCPTLQRRHARPRRHLQSSGQPPGRAQGLHQGDGQLHRIAV